MDKKITTWSSPAKLNLFLYVNSKREDGYHNIQTLYHIINYGDQIKIRRRSDSKIVLKCKDENISDENLIVQAANALVERIGEVPFGVDIILEKRLPIRAGLGGGSSNAATTLLALNKLWDHKYRDRTINRGNYKYQRHLEDGRLEIKEILKIGSKLGADIPVFIQGHSALASNKGDYLLPIFIPDCWYLVMCPKVGISTKEAFSHIPSKTSKSLQEMIEPTFDSLQPFSLEDFEKYIKNKFCEVEEAFSNIHKKVSKGIYDILQHPFSNDFEVHIRSKYPKVEEAFTWMKKLGLKARLTGTGSCVFAKVPYKAAGKRILSNVPKNIPSFIAKGVNISPVRQDMQKYFFR